MTQTHAPALRTATPCAEQAPRGFRLVCGGCGGNVMVEGDCTGRHVRCPHCSSAIKVLRSAPHTCEHCGANVGADLTAGLTVAVCEQCGHPYLLEPPIAPARKKHRRRRALRPHNHGPVAGTDGMGLIVLGAVILLGTLAITLLVMS